MFYDQFLRDFAALGRYLLQWLEGEISDHSLQNAIEAAARANPFFTPYMQRYAIGSQARSFLDENELSRWLRSYFPADSRELGNPVSAPVREKTVGIIMAGNIPLVGFHDLLCVLACGRRALVKMSSKDSCLLPAVLDVLFRIDPYWKDRVHFTEKMPYEVDALIATGSSETAAKVQKEYAGLPMLVRGRRFSYAVLEGRENAAQLGALGEDIFMYFGLGCRSVSYLLLPEGYDIGILTESLRPLRTLVAEKCYMNVYKRNKSILTMEGEDYTDGGFYIIRQTDEVFLPPGFLGYRTYRTAGDILEFEQKNSGRIQKKYRIFGQAQAPAIDDYADRIDTMKFILKH